MLNVSSYEGRCECPMQGGIRKVFIRETPHRDLSPYAFIPFSEKIKLPYTFDRKMEALSDIPTEGLPQHFS